jgi:hypothetical protein
MARGGGPERAPRSGRLAPGCALHRRGHSKQRLSVPTIPSQHPLMVQLLFKQGEWVPLAPVHRDALERGDDLQGLTALELLSLQASTQVALAGR